MPRKATSGIWTESFDKEKLPFSILCRCSNTCGGIDSWIACPTTLSGSKTNEPVATNNKTTIHTPPAQNLHLQMLCVANHSLSFCLKGTLCWSSCWRQLCLTSGGLWRSRALSFLCTFLRLELTLKIHLCEVVWGVLYLSVESIDLSSFCSHLQLNAGACHRHVSTFVVICLVRHNRE